MMVFCIDFRSCRTCFVPLIVTNLEGETPYELIPAFWNAFHSLCQYSVLDRDLLCTNRSLLIPHSQCQHRSSVNKLVYPSKEKFKFGRLSKFSYIQNVAGFLCSQWIYIYNKMFLIPVIPKQRIKKLSVCLEH